MTNKKRILTWVDGYEGRPGRWRKQINGQVYYFGFADSPNDTKAYRAAEDEYFQFRKKIEAASSVQIPLAKATVTDVSEKFLQDLQDRYERGEVSASYLEKSRCCLDDFCLFVQTQRRFSSIGELDLTDYRNHILTLPVSDKIRKKISPQTAKGRLATVRTLYRWAWRMHVVENMPRNLEGYANVELPDPKAEIFTLDELKTLWQKATPRVRCWMLLALNCGFYQGDIAELTASEVDWAEGRITRKRSKTGVLGSFKLWQTTLDHMLEQREPEAKDDERLFLTRPRFDGEAIVPLVTEKIVDGTVRRTDAVKTGFWKLLRKIGINSGRSFSSLRNTGASMIDEIDPLVTELYLSHATVGMKKHYVKRDWSRLDRALGKMEKQLKGVLK